LMSFEDRAYLSKTVHAKLRDTGIITLLRVLGAPVGSKVKNGTDFPEWLFDSPLSVQRDFLASCMGGDGEAPHMLKSNPSSAIRLSFHRSDALGDEPLEFARKLARLFGNFGVVVNDISKSPSKYERKDGLPTSQISLRFQLTEQNVLRICHAIGYRYCRRKSAFSSLAGEYLRIKSEQRKNIQQKMAEVRRLVSSGSSILSSSKSVGVSRNTASLWARSNSTSTTIRSYMVPQFLEWRKLAERNLGDGLVWETIVSKEEIELPRVMDLTLGNESHAFFANGFLVHNCDDHFHLDPLRDMLREQNVIGVLSVDATEAGLGIVSGEIWDVVDTITSGVSGKTRKGGQSARRYERLREMELTDYFNRLADHAKKTFIDQHPIKGLIVSGPGPTKDEFVKDGYLDYRLQNAIVGTLDTGYAGREGVRETVMKSDTLLQSVRFMEEKKLIDSFFREVNSDSGLAIYGIQDILAALKKSAVDTILVSDDVDLIYLKATCKNCENVTEKFVTRAQKMNERQSLLICPKCGSSEVEITEKDIVDYLVDVSVDSGANVEVISSKTEGGAMLKNFGGISAILRYRS
jgi:peptide chain release factor 1